MSSMVLYLDHQSHPAPLSLCYHASGSRALSASLPHCIPPSTSSTEIESCYCPQCLAFWDATSAAVTNFGVCTNTSFISTGSKISGDNTIITSHLHIFHHYGEGCKACPVCNSILVVSFMKDYYGIAGGNSGSHVCLLKCGYCQWDSAECSVVVPLSEDDKGEGWMEAAIRMLQTLLGQKIEESRKIQQDMNYALISEYKTTYAQEIKNRRQKELLESHGIALTKDFDKKFKDEARTPSQKIQDSAVDSLNRSFVPQIEKWTWKDQRSTKHQESLLASKSPRTYNNISLCDPSPSTLSFPLPVKLRSRTVRRCRAEIGAGRPGILVKPKGNPLDGDTSLRYGHGQWWKKDASAVHSVPNVRILKLGTDEESRRWAFLLVLSNPTLGPVNLRLHRDQDSINPSNKISDRLHDVILNPFTLRTVDARYITAKGRLNNTPNDFITLGPVEDVFVDLNASNQKDRNTMLVTRWEGKSAIKASFNESIRILEQDKDKAWVEYIVDCGIRTSTCVDAQFFATPLILSVQVGSNSWESSLIQSQFGTDGKSDCVHFPILLLWEGNLIQEDSDAK